MTTQVCLTCHVAYPIASGCPTCGDAQLDTLVAAASAPNLATLFQRGKEKGLIKPGKEYGST